MFIILVYDIDVKRVGKVLKKCREYLNWVQNSVFEGEITDVGGKDKPNIHLLFNGKTLNIDATKEQLSSIEENTTLTQNVRFYYPKIDDCIYYYKDVAVSYKTKDITREILCHVYKDSLAGGNIPCGEIVQDRDVFSRRKLSLRNKRARQGCIWLAEIIPVEQ